MGVVCHGPLIFDFITLTVFCVHILTALELSDINHLVRFVDGWRLTDESWVGFQWKNIHTKFRENPSVGPYHETYLSL
jgi:hypothetical protein